MSTRPEPIAHWSHTLALAGVLLLTTFYGHSRAALPQGPDAASHVERYTGSMLLEWLLLGSVVAGIYRRGDFFSKAFRSHALSPVKAMALGLLVYLAGTVAIVLVSALIALTPLRNEHNLQAVLAMMPHTRLEFLFWFGVSATAGICEELVFRGYLLQQFTAWTGRPVLSIFIAALLFGSVHLYEGLAAILPLAALAVVFGFVVRACKGNLYAVIVAHFLQDFLVAVYALAKPLSDRLSSGN